LCGLQPPEALNTTWQSHGSGLDIALAAKACRSYCGAIITGVANTTALEWMQDHLRAIGAGVHGLLVDVTNYVMHELGQPLHAFDRRLLEAGVIRVEEAADQYSSLTTLDGKEHALHSADLLITDGKKPLALAGVIGGQGSMVQDDTTAIVLESANFAAAGIRATRIRHGVTTDSAIRFEKTLPVEVSVAAANRAIELLLAACPDARVVCQASAGTQADDERTVTFDAERMPALTGIALPAADQIRHLEELGCQVAGTTVTVPWWRRKDINLSIDLVEEIARRHGYDAIQGQVPRLPAAAPAVNRLRQAEHRCRRILSGLGWDEVATYAFQSDAWTDILEIGEAAIRLQHPLAADQAVMRADPLATLLPAAGRNRRFLDSVLLYEIGKCYGTGYGLNDATANERQLVTGVISHANQASTGEITNDPFFAARDAAVALIRGLGYADLAVVASGANQPRLSPGRAAELHLGNTIVGWVSTTPSALVEASSINTGAAWFQIELERLVLHTPTPSPMHFKAVSRFQAVSRDFTFLIGDQHGFASVAEVIHNCSKDLVRSVDLAAEPYRGAGIPAGQRALSFRVVLQADDRTLSEKELSKAHTRIIKTVEHRLGASLRA
jgi:phenylalanyl-tRNA synthetase beta chain